jgi:4-oxalocrotonate tautomerase
MDPRFAAVVDLLGRYFDGLYRSDAGLLGGVFHPQAVYACASTGSLTHMTMDAYLPMVAARPSPASRGEARRDRILSVAFAGPVTALATVECAIAERRFTDLISLVLLDGEWRIIAKVFHFDIAPAA